MQFQNPNLELSANSMDKTYSVDLENPCHEQRTVQRSKGLPVSILRAPLFDAGGA